jgi:D-3-phosphoglycerate dehydrogenase / 2-oxoglutarate reductase
MKCMTTACKPAILATTSSFAREFAVPREILEGQGLQLFLNPWGRKLQSLELLELLERHRPVGLLAGTEPVTREVLTQARSYLQVISRVGAGWDNVDHQAAAELGMAVFRTTGVLTQAVAELTIGMMLAALRNILLQDRGLKEGAWHKRMGSLLQAKVVGLIGFGAIGQRVGELARAFGSEVIYCDPRPKSVPWASEVSLGELLQRAEIISLHVSGRETILGAAELNAVGKRGVILINTARGELVDEASLCNCLQDGSIGWACLDVFCQEPYRGPLCSMEQVILTPHVGSYALEARKLMEETAVANLLEGLQAVGVLPLKACHG